MVRSRKRSNSRSAFQILEPEPADLFPFEFCIPGKPVSRQAKTTSLLNAYKDHVREVARSLWRNEPSSKRLRMTGIHFFDAPDESGVPDSDNIMKPIRDCLNGIVYIDDRQVKDFRMRQLDLNASFRVKGMSRSLAWGFSLGEEFVHLLIEEDWDSESLY